jgi:hypothetical protein
MAADADRASPNRSGGVRLVIVQIMTPYGSMGTSAYVLHRDQMDILVFIQS